MKKLLIVCSLLAILTGCTNNSANGIQEQIVQVQAQENLIAGSGSNLVITRQLLEVYEKNSGKHIELPESIGSGGAIMAIKSGELSLGLTSRALKEDEIKDGLKQIPYAQIGVVIGVNARVSQDSITEQELVDIYAGKKTTWNNGDMIIVFSREDGDSSNSILEKNVPGFKEVLMESLQEKRWIVKFTDQDSAKAIENTSNSIGLTDTATIQISQLNLKPLKINNVEPTTENIMNGTYTLVKDLYFVYKEESIPKWAQDFIDFIYSEEGKRVMLQNGAIPLYKVSK